MIVEDSESVGMYTSIALDDNDYPHISYYNDVNTVLRYANRIGGSWLPITLDDTGGVGEYTSIAVDGSGFIHISYFDRTNGDLKYAWFKP